MRDNVRSIVGIVPEVNFAPVFVGA